MGAVDSKNAAYSDDEADEGGEDWMQADKYAEWECADHMDYNGIAVTVRHVEMPLNAEEKNRIIEAKKGDGTQEDEIFKGSGFTHEALVFDVMCVNGMKTKFCVELTYAGVLKRWGYHKVLSAVKGHKNINVPMTEVLSKIATDKKYNLILYNCKNYAADKFKEF